MMVDVVRSFDVGVYGVMPAGEKPEMQDYTMPPCTGGRV